MKYIKSSTEIDKVFAGNVRYKSWENRDKREELISLKFGFYKTMGKYYNSKRKVYWTYEMLDDFTIIPTDLALVPSLEPISKSIYKELVHLHGKAYADELKTRLAKRMKENDFKNYSQQIDEWLEEVEKSEPEA